MSGEREIIDLVDSDDDVSMVPVQPPVPVAAPVVDGGAGSQSFSVQQQNQIRLLEQQLADMQQRRQQHEQRMEQRERQQQQQRQQIRQEQREQRLQQQQLQQQQSSSSSSSSSN